MANSGPLDEIFLRLDRLKIDQKELAVGIDLSADKLSKIRRGIRQWRGEERALALAWVEQAERNHRRSDVRPAEVLPAIGGSGADDVVELIRLDLSLAMGDGTNIDDYIEEEPVKFDLGYLRAITRTPPHRIRLARGIGDSMFPTLQSSDEVMIDTTSTMLNLNDRVWAISMYGAGAIKRLRAIGPQRVLVISDNPAVPDQEIDAEDLRIFGRVFRLAREL
ncbi:S24 family peptidase [Sphingomonas sp.]|uniref:S24 family peptidase n=1 Tax=Sphingomonas sp. TaxID=28214 RepID=UPI003BA914D6